MASHLYNLLQLFFFLSFSLNLNKSYLGILPFFNGFFWWPTIFNFCNRFSIGFKLGIIQSHGRTVIFFWSHTVIDLDACLGLLSCWKVNHQLRSRFCIDSCRFLSSIFIQSSHFIIPLIAINCPVLKQSQNIIIKPLPRFDDHTLSCTNSSVHHYVKKTHFFLNHSKIFVPKRNFIFQECFSKMKPSNNVTWFVKSGLTLVSIQPISF